MWWQAVYRKIQRCTELTACLLSNLHQKSDLALEAATKTKKTQTQRQGAEIKSPSKLERDAGIRERKLTSELERAATVPPGEENEARLAKKGQENMAV